MRLWYMYENEVCTIIDIDKRERNVRICNYTGNYALRAFGRVEKPTYEQYEEFFLNEDRHPHNIAVLMDAEGAYHYCLVFDSGAGLLSDTTMNYPTGIEVGKLIGKPKAKTFCQDFDEQLNAIEYLYGQHLKFHCHSKN